MPAEVSVGPPVLSINRGTTFMVTGQHGDIDANSEQGIFAADTRFVSHLRLTIQGRPWVLLTSAVVHHYTVQLQLANPAVVTSSGEIRAHDLGLAVSRLVADGIHEDLDITSYAPRAVSFKLEVSLASDFADIFEVREHHLTSRSGITTAWDAERSELSTTYKNQDFERSLVYRLTNPGSPASFSNGPNKIAFDVTLQPGEAWHCCAGYVLSDGERIREPPITCSGSDRSARELGRLQAEWLSNATLLTSANEDVYRAYLRSVKDMGALRMHEQDMSEDAWVPAAGVPWYVALFGRDSLIASLQTMLVQPAFALGALRKLAQFQAVDFDDWRDAEPGKILHELRVGELAHFNRIPHTPYYGAADSTPLYLIVLHEAWRWLGDLQLLRDHREVALRCLEWIDRYGDLDGDGFQEYQTRSPQGYENMGWKDSGDAIVYPDGRPVPQPKALVELQGYVFDAKLRMAEVFDALGEPDRAASLRAQAASLQQRFEEAFWSDDFGAYALCLDPHKQPVQTLASNVGHCLWSGIVRPDRAERMLQRFFDDEMWTGWGVRTLAAGNPAFNPFSYHNGSIWPHDNGILALGLKRYGFAAEASRVARDIFGAAAYFNRYRLPELYAGLSKRETAFPVQYIGANVPQAWAAGSVFDLLRAILGLRADASRRVLYVHPTLPRWLPDISLGGLAVGETRLTLRFWREAEQSRWAVVDQWRGPQVTVVEEPWTPWSPGESYIKPGVARPSTQ
jgi:glycogen debranching enzyme